MSKSILGGDEEQQDNILDNQEGLCAISPLQRVYGFAACMVSGVVCMFLCFIVFAKPIKFGLLFTFGNLLAVGSQRELLSSHGFTKNQLWKYPSMVKMAELMGHTSRVLFMAQSPDGCTVASAAGDEILRFWNVFGTPEVKKQVPKSNLELFAHVNRIR
ncbi:unnamed protein product [Cuscuta campestris]|uniref:Uncharacterized protein n=1 Tax=Cuscuta campestris TaxID=132261 RepID=A0A484N791_9ASTE|nr:unnamed protein product [Cuscuta campestris]